MENTFTDIIIRFWLPSLATEADWVLSIKWHSIVPLSLAHYHRYYNAERFPNQSFLPTFLHCHPNNLTYVPLLANEPSGLLLFLRTGRSRLMLPLLGCHLAFFGLRNCGYFYALKGTNHSRVFIFTPPLNMLDGLPEIEIIPKVPSQVLYAATHHPFGKGWELRSMFDDFSVFYHTKTDTLAVQMSNPLFFDDICEILEDEQTGNNKDRKRSYEIVLGYSEEAQLYLPSPSGVYGSRIANPSRGCALCAMLQEVGECR